MCVTCEGFSKIHLHFLYKSTTFTWHRQITTSKTLLDFFVPYIEISIHLCLLLIPLTFSITLNSEIKGIWTHNVRKSCQPEIVTELNLTGLFIKNNAVCLWKLIFHNEDN